MDDAQLELEVQALHEALSVLVEAVSDIGVRKMSDVGLARAKFLLDEVGKEAARLTPLVKVAEKRQQQSWVSKGLALFRG
jgi:hypothetical protein